MYLILSTAVLLHYSMGYMPHTRTQTHDVPSRLKSWLSLTKKPAALTGPAPIPSRTPCLVRAQNHFTAWQAAIFTSCCVCVCFRAYICLIKVYLSFDIITNVRPYTLSMAPSWLDGSGCIKGIPPLGGSSWGSRQKPLLPAYWSCSAGSE